MKSGWTTKKLGEIGTIVRGKGIRRSKNLANAKERAECNYDQ